MNDKIRHTKVQLDALVSRVLFGNDWPPDAHVLFDWLEKFELIEKTPGNRNTALGNMLQIDLHLAFLGLLDESEVPVILQDYHLFSREESAWVWEQLEANANITSWLQRRLQQVYRHHIGQPRNN